MAEVKKTNFIALIVIVVIVALIFLLSSISPEKTPSEVTIPVPESGPIVIKGEMTCLPHKDTSGPQTLECAFGLEDETGRYFALKDTDPEYKNVSGVPMGVLVEVEGVFMPTTDSIYQNIGIIEVTRITVEPENVNGEEAGVEEETTTGNSSSNGSTNSSGNSTVGSGTITGIVMIGPGCPAVQNPEEVCDEKPYKTTLSVTPVSSSRVVKTFTSDTNGKFRISVPPGDYIIDSADETAAIPYCRTAGAVKVRENATTETKVSCDNGEEN